jgi:hypothetical protein
MRSMPYREKSPAIYILASRRNGTLYTFSFGFPIAVS